MSSSSIGAWIVTVRVAMRCAASSTLKAIGDVCSRCSPMPLRLKVGSSLLCLNQMKHAEEVSFGVDDAQPALFAQAERLSVPMTAQGFGVLPSTPNLKP